jgi:hypothetical protein
MGPITGAGQERARDGALGAEQARALDGHLGVVEKVAGNP